MNTREAQIEQARRFIATGISEDLKEVLEQQYPELKESKDERIRKAILGLAYLDGIEPILAKCSITARDIRTYLIKQKEQPTNEEMLRTLRAEYEKGVADTIAKYEQKEQKPAECIEDSVKFEEGFKAGRESGLLDGQKYVLNNLDSYGLGKPAEWSEEDKRKLNRIYEILGHAAEDKGFLTSKRIIGDKEAIELQDFLKSLRPQPKQEWSEEDEKTIKEAIHRIEQLDHYWNRPTDEKLIERLKSLRPQPHWKPSEEQMEALKWSIDAPEEVNNYVKRNLESLLDDLEKL